MTTSGTITASMTARDVITRAYKILGVYDNNQDADTFADGLTALNWMLKSMALDGANLWREALETLTIPANTASITLTPNIIDVMSARVLISSTYERDMGRWEREEYDILPNKTATGTPVVYHFRKQTGNAQFFVWQVPNVDTTIKATVQRIIEDVTNLNQTLDIPQEYTETVCYCLADRMIDDFGVALMDRTTADRVQLRAGQLYQRMLDADRPTSYTFRPLAGKT